MGKKRGDDGYRGVMEGQGDGSDRVVAGEARRGSARGLERRLPAGARAQGGVGAGSGGKDRARLAEVLSSAGVDAGRVALEVLYMLPETFLRGYEDLFHRALDAGGGDGSGGSGRRDEAKGELGRATGKRVLRDGGRRETMAGAKAPKKTGGSGRGGFRVKDERALGEKERIDRQLRKLARQMRDGGAAGTGKELVTRCGEEWEDEAGGSYGGRGCGKWLERGWKWCPHCGLSKETGRRT